MQSVNEESVILLQEFVADIEKEIVNISWSTRDQKAIDTLNLFLRISKNVFKNKGNDISLESTIQYIEEAISDTERKPNVMEKKPNYVPYLKEFLKKLKEYKNNKTKDVIDDEVMYDEPIDHESTVIDQDQYKQENFNLAKDSFILKALASIWFKLAMSLLILAAVALILVVILPELPIVGAVGAAVVGYLGFKLALGAGIGAAAVGVTGFAASFFADRKTDAEPSLEESHDYSPT